MRTEDRVGKRLLEEVAVSAGALLVMACLLGLFLSPPTIAMTLAIGGVMAVVCVMVFFLLRRSRAKSAATQEI